ncbi:hypothetical protein [Streptomyces malaysiensis]|uniref:PAS/PAC sensor hybrid histidine kinase n=1 Tax=Streptomyces malaysiensis TaxID=92644 RepID=A0A7X5X7Q2_STRMQ|nr:hypothetical protein [Streptomyces malaysiensis]NIY68102.1 PAS/PAC sensor hybrid histidine kinase [Streptomyces malaysiensis]
MIFIPLHDLLADDQNATRAGWAQDALKAFGGNTGQNYFDGALQPEDLDLVMEAGGDLVCALMHLARKLGGNAEQLLEQGREHFEYEVREEEAEKSETEGTV